MSNLGRYQDTVTFAKKVGGPVNLKLIHMVVGALIGLLPSIIKKVSNMIKRLKQSAKSKKEKKCENSSTEYEVITEGTSNEGLAFEVGEKYRVLESDGDAVLIEKVGDVNNPYFVSANLLKKISDYLD